MVRDCADFLLPINLVSLPHSGRQRQLVQVVREACVGNTANACGHMFLQGLTLLRFCTCPVTCHCDRRLACVHSATTSGAAVIRWCHLLLLVGTRSPARVGLLVARRLWRGVVQAGRLCSALRLTGLFSALLSAVVWT